VFTLIQKFQPAKGEQAMPVLSDRSDVIVITDEAHRSQYDTLALNMRVALASSRRRSSPLVEARRLDVVVARRPRARDLVHAPGRGAPEPTSAAHRDREGIKCFSLLT
jgi:hypothetical protein